MALQKLIQLVRELRSLVKELRLLCRGIGKIFWKIIIIIFLTFLIKPPSADPLLAMQFYKARESFSYKRS